MQRNLLWPRFEDAIVAATLAEAGEIETARKIATRTRRPKNRLKRKEMRNVEV